MKKIITAVIFALPLTLFISIASAAQVEQKYPCSLQQMDQNLVDAKSRIEADFRETQKKSSDITQQHQKAIQSRDEELKNLYNDCNDRWKKNGNNFIKSQEIIKDCLRNEKDIQNKYNKIILKTWNDLNKLQKREDFLQSALLKLQAKKQREEEQEIKKKASDDFNVSLIKYHQEALKIRDAKRPRDEKNRLIDAIAQRIESLENLKMSCEKRKQFESEPCLISDIDGAIAPMKERCRELGGAC